VDRRLVGDGFRLRCRRLTRDVLTRWLGVDRLFAHV
jgi:hypothetical protein